MTLRVEGRNVEKTERKRSKAAILNRAVLCVPPFDPDWASAQVGRRVLDTIACVDQQHVSAWLWVDCFEHVSLCERVRIGASDSVTCCVLYGSLTVEGCEVGLWKGVGSLVPTFGVRSFRFAGCGQ